MAHNQKILSDWLFLYDTQRIRALSRSVAKTMTVNTCQFYLRNIHNFLEFLRETPPRTNRLTRRQLNIILREIKMSIIGARVVVHQMATKRKKMGNLPSSADLTACLALAAQKIPQLLDKLEQKLTPSLRFLYYIATSVRIGAASMGTGQGCLRTSQTRRWMRLRPLVGRRGTLSILRSTKPTGPLGRHRFTLARKSSPGSNAGRGSRPALGIMQTHFCSTRRERVPQNTSTPTLELLGRTWG